MAYWTLWVALYFAAGERAARLTSHHSTRLAVDDRIPFRPGFVLPYLSGYILSNVGYLVLSNRDYFPQVALGFIILFFAGILSYVLFPCRVHRIEVINGTGISETLLSAFQRTAKPYNSFPSMHVSFSLMSALTVASGMDRFWESRC